MDGKMERTDWVRVCACVRLNLSETLAIECVLVYLSVRKK